MAKMKRARRVHENSKAPSTKKERGVGERIAKVLWLCIYFDQTRITIAMKECLKLTKALVKTSETMQNVADLYDDHVGCDELFRSRLFLVCTIGQEDTAPHA